MVREQPNTSREWRKTLSQGIVDDLRSAILRGELEAGRRLLETELAETYRVSRGPLREAFRILEREGLVQYVPRRGTFVTSLSRKDWQETYSLRLLLETFAYRLVAEQIVEDDIAHLQTMVDDMRLAGDRNDVAWLLDIDLKFHAYFVGRSGHRRLMEVWENLSQIMSAVFLYVMRERHVAGKAVGDRHQEILDAFASRNVGRVEQILRLHYFIDEFDASEGETHA